MSIQLKLLNDVITQCNLIDEMIMDGTYGHAQGDFHYHQILCAVGEHNDVFEDEEVRRHLDWYYDAMLQEDVDQLGAVAFYLTSTLVKHFMTRLED